MIFLVLKFDPTGTMYKDNEFQAPQRTYTEKLMISF